MNFANIIVICIITYYLNYTVLLIISSKKRNLVKDTNTKLNELRKIPYKTLEEQKKFIDLMYPKSGKFIWKSFFKALSWGIPLAILLFTIVRQSFIIFHIQFNVISMIIFTLVGPLIINIILAMFKLDKSNLIHILKWK